MSLADEGLNFSIHWSPFQLNPTMAKEGVDRAQYRAWKFGGAEKAAAGDARIIEAAAKVGLDFHPERITRTPNTIDAHRLILVSPFTRTVCRTRRWKPCSVRISSRPGISVSTPCWRIARRRREWTGLR